MTTEKLFEFKKPKIRLGEKFDIGYYFKGKFLGRYKNKAVETLRSRVENLPDEERYKTDEWKVIRQEYIKNCQAVEKTRQTKQPYFQKLKKQVLKRRILILQDKISNIEERKKDALKNLDEKIVKINQEIQQIEESLK